MATDKQLLTPRGLYVVLESTSDPKVFNWGIYVHSKAAHGSYYTMITVDPKDPHINHFSNRQSILSSISLIGLFAIAKVDTAVAPTISDCGYFFPNIHSVIKDEANRVKTHTDSKSWCIQLILRLMTEKIIKTENIDDLRGQIIAFGNEHACNTELRVGSPALNESNIQ